MKLPKTPRGVYCRIEQLKKILKKEKREWGAYDDSYGRRLLIGPLYLLANDTEGALKYYKWYEKNFPDDCSEPFNYLCWSLILHRADKEHDADLKLYRTMLSNIYLLPYLLDADQPSNGIEYGSNWEDKNYAFQIPEEYLAVWTDDEKGWANSVYHGEEVSRYRNKYIELKTILNVLNPGFERSETLNEMHAIRDTDPFKLKK